MLAHWGFQREIIYLFQAMVFYTTKLWITLLDRNNCHTPQYRDSYSDKAIIFHNGTLFNHKKNYLTVREESSPFNNIIIIFSLKWKKFSRLCNAHINT